MAADYHILVDGERVRLVGVKHFLVASKSQSGDHAVEYDETEGWRCSCVGWNVRKDCRHARAIKRWSFGQAEVQPWEDT